MIEYERTGDRAAGNTYRMLLKALELATSGPNRNIFLLFGTGPALNHAMQQISPMTHPLQSFSMVHFSRNYVSFKNGSRITFYVGGSDLSRLAGMKIWDYAIDLSLDRLDPEIADWLRHAVRKN